MEGPKENIERVENIALNEYEQHEAAQEHVMRSKVDDLSVWQCARQFKVLSLIAMAAAFSASLDGYREFNPDTSSRIKPYLTTFFAEINLNGGIVANKGFIRQMASAGTTVIAGKYISAWGGIQSAGQTVGQIVSIISSLEVFRILRSSENILTVSQLLQYATEAYGRKMALYIIWVDLVVVGGRCYHLES